MTEEKQNDWIEWSGGECPVAPCVIVDVRCRDGYEACNEARFFAAELNDGRNWWSHTPPEAEDCFDRRRADDIIAYRVALALRQHRSGAGGVSGDEAFPPSMWLEAWLTLDGVGYTRSADEMRAAIRRLLAAHREAHTAGPREALQLIAAGHGCPAALAEDALKAAKL